MSMVILHNEMVEPPDGSGGYYKVDIKVQLDGTYTCTIPEIGRCIVAKEMPRYSYQPGPFAWKIVHVYPKRNARKRNTCYT